MSEQNPFASDEQDPFESRDRQAVPVKKGLSGCAIAGIGCGIFIVLMLIAGGIGAWWLSQNMREFGTDFAVTAMKEGLKELEVPEDQRQRMHARIDEVGEQFKEGKLTLEEVGAIFERIAEGPLLPAGISLFVKRVYIRDSGLDEDEKEAAHVAIQRFSRGVIDESIPEAKREAVLDMISKKDFQGNREFKQKLTDAELRAFIKAVKDAADEAGVPDEVPEINFADEFDKAIEEALGQVHGEWAVEEEDEIAEDLSIEEPDVSGNEAPGDDVPSEVGAETSPATTE